MGLRTGRFTSPHLEDFRERICINGKPISQEELDFTYNDIKAYFDFVDGKSKQPLSYFEIVTALAFAAFAEHPVDIGIFEVGMGGEWDATNVVKPDVAVITPIGLDHQEFLGKEILQIAETKAGILKPDSIAVLAEQEPEVAKLLLRKAAENGMDVARAGLDFEILQRQIAVGGQLLTIRGRKDVYSDFKKNITKRRTLEQQNSYKVFIPASLRCTLTLGNHHVVDYDKSIFNEYVDVPHVELESISIAHFPVRSREQYNRKIDFFKYCRILFPRFCRCVVDVGLLFQLEKRIDNGQHES